MYPNNDKKKKSFHWYFESILTLGGTSRCNRLNINIREFLLCLGFSTILQWRINNLIYAIKQQGKSEFCSSWRIHFQDHCFAHLVETLVFNTKLRYIYIFGVEHCQFLILNPYKSLYWHSFTYSYQNLSCVINLSLYISV